MQGRDSHGPGRCPAWRAAAAAAVIVFAPAARSGAAMAVRAVPRAIGPGTGLSLPGGAAPIGSPAQAGLGLPLPHGLLLPALPSAPLPAPAIRPHGAGPGVSLAGPAALFNGSPAALATDARMPASVSRPPARSAGISLRTGARGVARAATIGAKGRALDALFSGADVADAPGIARAPASRGPRLSSRLSGRDWARVRDEILAQDYFTGHYSESYLKELVVTPDRSFLKELGWTATTPRRLRALADRFRFPEGLGGRLKLDLHLLRHVGRYQSPNFVLVGVVRDSRAKGKPVGVMVLTVVREFDELRAKISAVYFDRSDPKIRGMAPAILDFLREHVYPPIPVEGEILIADTAGRYVWAKLGFRFGDFYRLYDVGDSEHPLPYAEIARRNLRRFLKRHGMRWADLVREDGRPLRSWKQLVEPWDFAGVRHKEGKTIRIRPYASDGVLGEPTDLPVGKAFMLADYRPAEGAERIKTVSKFPTEFAADAMPWWFGVRPIAPVLHPERTASRLPGPSLPTRLAGPLLNGRILDYGAGTGRDTRWLKSLGRDAVAYDPHFFPEKPRRGRGFDWTLLNFVLNVIPGAQERDAVLRDIHGLLKPGGRILVSVRSLADVERYRKKTWTAYKDGWITTARTFHHGYTAAELKEQLARNGFEVERTLPNGSVVARKLD